jgi:hypothetical protein
MVSVAKTGVYQESVYEDGLAALAVLDPKRLIETCVALLSANPLTGKDADTIGVFLGRRFSRLLVVLIQKGRREDYAKFITKENIAILLRHGKKDGSADIELKDLKLDWQSFGIDPADLEKDTAH